MTKYNRHNGAISRVDDDSTDSYWQKQFEKQLNKDAVQSRKVDTSLFDQINTIMNGKSKYQSVDAAVEDMKHRSGLTAYLSKMNESKSDETKKIAQVPTALPDVIKKVPQIQKTINEIIDGCHGELPVISIIHKVKAIHKTDISDDKDWNNNDLLIYVSGLCMKAKKENSINKEDYDALGKTDKDTENIDPSNVDAFHSLNPVSK
jgi:hypothetical protein